MEVFSAKKGLLMFEDNSTEEFVRIKITQQTLSGSEALLFKELCRKKLEEGRKDFYFDMSIVEYIDSATIAQIMYVSRYLRVFSKQVFVVNCKPDVKNVFTRLHLDTLFMVT